MKNLLILIPLFCICTAMAQTTQPGLRVSEELWGTTIAGGVSDVGVIYKFDPNSRKYTLIRNFSPTSGGNPNGNLLQLNDKFYGFAELGGSNNVGVVFNVDTVSGTNYAVMHQFAGFLGGARPSASPVLLNNKLYGVGFQGGNNGTFPGEGGVLFEINPANPSSYAIKHHFSFSNGHNPLGFLHVFNGKLYGMTYLGGSFNRGVVYCYDPSINNYVVLHQFNGTQGGKPAGNSLIVVNNKLYGMTTEGGSNNFGVLFQLDLATNQYSILHHFSSISGSNPLRGLLHNDGVLYGMTYNGGNSNSGVIFKYILNGGYSVLRHFNGANGASPVSTLIFKNNYLYGTTQYGGVLGAGVIFRTTTNDNEPIEVLHSFDGTLGGRPNGYMISPTHPCSFSGWLTSTTPDLLGNGTGSITISHQTVSGQGYQYSIDAGVTYQNSPTFMNLSAGNYNVRVKDVAPGGCLSNIDVVTVSLGQSSTEDGLENPIEKVYVNPNPSKGIFSIQVGESGEKHCLLFNTQGQKVGEWHHSETEWTLDLSDKPVGVYHLLIRNQFGEETRSTLVVAP